mmetsp:Transcript_50947/g.103581  ORF Transcript_50947/g.103581 Transcript_50947/m.103581 type:complete len:132 (+) Transcript_50947:294-689(+)
MCGHKQEAHSRKEKTFHEKSCAGEQFQNGRAEAKIWTLSIRTRTMMMFANCPPSWWPYTWMYATLLENVTKPHSKNSAITPYEMFKGRAPNLSILHLFGRYAVANIEKQNVQDGKLSWRGVPCVFAGLGLH